MIDGGWGIDIHVRGAKRDPNTRVMSVGTGLLQTMQIPILAGRGIEEHDRPGSPEVAVVSARFAKANFGDSNPLGQRLIIQKGNTAAGIWRLWASPGTHNMAA